MNKQRLPHFIVWFIGLVAYLLPLQTSAQDNFQTFDITGVVTDTLHNPIPLCNVYLQSENVIKKFAVTNKQGKFTFRVPLTIGFPITIKTKSLNYEEQSRVIDSKASLLLNSHIQFTLRSKTFILNEVIVSKKKDIVVSGDTVKYRVEAFANKQEKVMEDLLKKLPGFGVDANGGITYRNKPIQKILIEGDDLIDRNYTLLSKNIPAYMIDEVQVLNKFSDNYLLKGIENTEEVAVNIKLNQTKIGFGNASAGYGTNRRHEWRTNIFSLLKKLKVYALGTSNNIGINPIGHLPFSSEMPQNTPFALPASYAPISTNSINLPKIDGAQTNRNLSGLYAINVTTKLSPKIHIKTNLSVLNDSRDFFTNTQTEYRLLNNVFSFIEKNEEKYAQNDKNGNIEVVIKPDKNQELLLKTRYQYQQNQDFRKTVFNEIGISSIGMERTRSWYEFVRYTKRITENKAVILQGIYAKTSTPQELNISNPIGGQIFANSSDKDSLFKQTFENPIQYFSSNIQWLAKTGKVNYITRVGFDKQVEIGSSRFFIGSTIPTLIVADGLKNELEYNKTKFFLGGQLKYTLKQVELVANSDLNVSRNLYQDGLITKILNRAYFDVDISSIFLLSKDRRIVLNLHTDNTTPTLGQIIPKYIFADYRNFIGGSQGHLLVQQTRLASFLYSANNITKGSHLSTALSIGQIPKSYNQRFDISPNHTFSSLVEGQGSYYYQHYLDVSQFLAFLASTVKMKSKYRSLVFYNQSGSSEDRRVSNQSWTYNFSIRTGWQKILNADVGLEYNMNKFSVNRSSEITTEYLNLYGYLFLNASDKLRATIQYDYYKFADSKAMSFANFSIDYPIKSNKWLMSLSGKNLLRLQNIEFLANSDFKYSSVSYSIAEPYVMLKMEYRF